MSDYDPPHGPLGSRPILPAPEGEPARRAREMFSAYLAETRAYRAKERERGNAPALAPAAAPEASMPRTPTPRRYDLALSLLGADSEREVTHGARTSSWEPNPGSTPVPSARATDERAPEDELAVSRPPVGAAAVRPSAPSRPAPEAIDQRLLETLADNALLHQKPDGTAAFEVSFHDEVFRDLACTIQFGESGVIATFRALDVNTRRLLEAEAGRLRVRLEDRGLKVQEVRVAGDPE